MDRQAHGRYILHTIPRPDTEDVSLEVSLLTICAARHVSDLLRNQAGSMSLQRIASSQPDALSFQILNGWGLDGHYD